MYRLKYPRVLRLLQVGWADTMDASGWRAAPFAQPVAVPDHPHNLNGRPTAVTALGCCRIGWPHRDGGVAPVCQETCEERACEEGGLAGGPCLSRTP